MVMSINFNPILMKNLLLLLGLTGLVFTSCSWDNNNGETKRASESKNHDSVAVVEDSIKRMDQPTPEDKDKGRQGK